MTFRARLASLLLLLVAVMVGGAQAFAAPTRTISNVATIAWGPEGNRQQASSNRVDTLVMLGAPSVASPFTLPPGNFSAALLQASCGVAGSETLASKPITPAPELIVGQPLVIALDRPSANIDPTAIDRLTLVVRSGNDEERLLFVESAPNSGRFLAVVRTGTGTTVANDCRLSVAGSNNAQVELLLGGVPIAGFSLRFLVDPFGLAFDSRDGAAVSGVRITLIDAATGRPATVFGDDGVSAYPASVVTGQTVVDAGGTTYTFAAGDYRFPLVNPGTYRLQVEPVAPYSFASTRSAAELAGLRRPDGSAFTVTGGSYGQSFTLSSPEAVRIDIPLDRPVLPLVVTKTASRADAEEGDLVQYRVAISNPDGGASGALSVDDRIPAQMRLRAGTTRLDGEAASDPAVDGKSLRFILPALSGGGQHVLSYVLEVLPGAAAGDALNRVQVSSAGGSVSNIADAVVRIRRDTIAGRMTIVGRITDGDCTVDPATRPGVPGVRVMLEDGSYTVTDPDGRYHFEGILPGTHVVQIDEPTLGGRAAVDCAASVRSGGRATSRFVDGLGGGLKRVDFNAVASGAGDRVEARPVARPAVASDQDAAGSGRDWLKDEAPGVAFLFPTVDHNPRAPAVRVAIKHLPGQRVRLLADGRAVDPVTFEGERKNAAGTVAVSLWRGVPIDRERTMLAAEILGADGKVVTTLRRPLFFSNSAARVELVPSLSRLVADGVHRPVIALRVTDAHGRPVHHGLAGEFELPEPYYPAIEADAQQARQLAGLERARPAWRVEGDSGLAFVELEPTTASGSLAMRFALRDGQRARIQRVDAWMAPGERSWTMVGLAEGSIGFNRLNKHVEAIDAGRDKPVTDGRLAFYAKGRVQGRWLLTLSYDSDRKARDARFAQTIDPTAYYTVYADRSEQRYDAASVKKLYLRLERPQFYALFGDYQTGFDEAELTRYGRALTGGKAEYGSDRLSVSAFAAKASTSHRREEIQGNGLSGPYALAARNLLANGEKVVIEVRDRLRSDRIVERRALVRHVDYDIDYAAGTLRFRAPVLSRSADGDPTFIVADYELDGLADGKLVAGARVALRSADQRLQVAATAVHDADDLRKTDLAGVDVRFRPANGTDLRGEVAVSRSSQDGGHDSATAWKVEAEHHAGAIDLLAYASRRETNFGVGQTNAAEAGTRKVGVDGRVMVGKSLEASLSAWNEKLLASGAERSAGRALLEYRGRDRSLRAGLVLADDRLADGREARSTLLQLGASQKLFANRLELDAQSELPLGGEDASIDFPARHRLSGRFAVNRDLALTGSYEIAEGDAIEARTARVGFELAPWTGARIALAGNNQNIAEYGPRSFASFGLAQSLVLSSRLTVDASVDGNRTVGGIDPARVINPAHPVASGGFLGSGGLTEDFIALTAGATWRADRWSLTGRGEYRDAEEEDRRGLTVGALRQIGEGRALGGSFNWFDARTEQGTRTRTVNAQLAWAHRPASSAWAFLDKLEIRADSVRNALAGARDVLGNPLTVVGDASSTRLINSLSVNYSPRGRAGPWLDRTEIALFWGARYVADRFDGDDIKGFSNLVGGDVRFDLGRRVEIGLAGTARVGMDGRALDYAGGPQVGFAPFANGWLQLGYNVHGFRDRDFDRERFTRDGPYATVRFKFDQNSLAGLGLGRR